jgi:hypothetical protein
MTGQAQREVRVGVLGATGALRLLKLEPSHVLTLFPYSRKLVLLFATSRHCRTAIYRSPFFPSILQDSRSRRVRPFSWSILRESYKMEAICTHTQGRARDDRQGVQSIAVRRMRDRL